MRKGKKRVGKWKPGRLLVFSVRTRGPIEPVLFILLLYDFLGSKGKGKTERLILQDLLFHLSMGWVLVYLHSCLFMHIFFPL